MRRAAAAAGAAAGRGRVGDSTNPCRLARLKEKFEDANWEDEAQTGDESETSSSSTSSFALRAPSAFPQTRLLNLQHMFCPSVKWNEVCAGSPLIRGNTRETEEGSVAERVGGMGRVMLGVT